MNEERKPGEGRDAIESLADRLASAASSIAGRDQLSQDEVRSLEALRRTLPATNEDEVEDDGTGGGSSEVASPAGESPAPTDTSRGSHTRKWLGRGLAAAAILAAALTILQIRESDDLTLELGATWERVRGEESPALIVRMETGGPATLALALVDENNGLWLQSFSEEESTYLREVRDTIQIRFAHAPIDGGSWIAAVAIASESPSTDLEPIERAIANCEADEADSTSRAQGTDEALAGIADCLESELKQSTIKIVMLGSD